MNGLVIMHEQQAVTTSLKVAEVFGKEHKVVLRAIEDKIQSAQNYADYKKMFEASTYTDSRGREQKVYFMNRDGFTFIAFGFTGKAADQFKLKYISAFNAMEKTIKSLPIKKLDPVKQAEIAMTNAKTRQANALYRIAMKAESISSQQALLAKAAEAITGEMVLPTMRTEEFSATQVAKKLGITSNKVGRIANRIGIKAEQPGQNEFGRWSASKSQHSDKEVPQWLYTKKGLAAIRSAIKE